MVLIVETGTGLATANSYLTENAASIYHNLYGNAAWAAATMPAKEIALLKATQYLDGKYSLLWKGSKKTAAQALDWPRYSVADRSGFVYSSEALPTELKNATAEAALVALTENLQPAVAAGSNVTFKDIKVGEIQIKKAFGGGSTSTYKTYTQIVNLLRELVLGGNDLGRA